MWLKRFVRHQITPGAFPINPLHPVILSSCLKIRFRVHRAAVGSGQRKRKTQGDAGAPALGFWVRFCAVLLLASFAFAAVAHGFDRAGHFLLFGEFGFRAGDDATEFLFHIGGWAFDAGRTKRAEVVGRFETCMPSAAIHAACDFEVRLTDEEVDGL